MKILPEMKSTTIRIVDGIISLEQMGYGYHTETIKIPVSQWGHFVHEVSTEIVNPTPEVKEAEGE